MCESVYLCIYLRFLFDGAMEETYEPEGTIYQSIYLAS